MWPQLTLVTALAGTASALLVAKDSPCEKYCGNVLSSTTGADMTCVDSDYSSKSAGIVFETCINCELKSNYTNGNETDLEFLIYNLRYTASYCLFGINNPDIQSSPCLTSTACGPLEDAVDWKNLTTNTGAYDFCQAWLEDQVPKCNSCLEPSNEDFMVNYLTILDAACLQMPAAGSTLSVQGTPFSTVHMNITTPSATPLYTYTPDQSAISLGGKVGIAIGGLVFLLSVVGFTIVCLGRRRRRAYLKSVAARYGNPGWPSPPGNTHDMFGTPMSQKPLRGWDDNSPVSAGAMSEQADKNYPMPRYFSPYNSQYNSPVSAEDAPEASWSAMPPMSNAFSTTGGSPQPMPSFAGPSRSSSSPYSQEEVERMAHEHQLAQIGLALGGSDPSLRSKNSNASMGAADVSPVDGPSQPQAVFRPASVHGGTAGDVSATSSLSSFSAGPGAIWEPSKGKARQGSDESYELREIDSSGAPGKAPATAQAPVLQHPGYGRGRSQQYYPPPPPPRMGPLPYELTAEDARHGKAL